MGLRLRAAALAAALALAAAAAAEPDWDRAANIKAAAVQMAAVHRQKGFFGGFDEVKRCYAAAPAQAYTRQLEFCMAQDYVGAHVAASTYRELSPDTRKQTGSPDPDAVLRAMAARIQQALGRAQAHTADAHAFVAVAKRDGLAAYKEARFP